MQNKLAVEYRKVDALIPFARNARTHSPAQIAKIAASIVEFGWTNPILVDGHNGIIAGHGRLAGAMQLGLVEVPVIELGHLTPAQRRAYVIADNQLALDAGWDNELLALELHELNDAGYDLALTGLDADALEELLASDDDETQEPTGDEDAVPDIEAETVSLPGDVWHLGRHRLICGDAADPAAIAALMQAERARLCVTSPPYGNQREYTTGGIADWDALMRGVFSQLPVAHDGQVLVNLGLIHRDNEVVLYWDTWIEWMRTQDWRRFGWYVWDQGPGMPGDWRGRLAPSFEFVFHFNRVNRKPNKIVPCKNAGEDKHLRLNGTGSAMRNKDGKVRDWSHAGQLTQDTRIPDSVIRVTRHKNGLGKGLDHPAVFPIALPQFVIEAYSDVGDIVFEPFGGSGTTMLAAEATDRACRSVEIAPPYVDVAIRRFQRNHPGVAVTLAATGQSFEEVTTERLRETEKA